MRPDFKRSSYRIKRTQDEDRLSGERSSGETLLPPSPPTEFASVKEGVIDRATQLRFRPTNRLVECQFVHIAGDEEIHVARRRGFASRMASVNERNVKRICELQERGPQDVAKPGSFQNESPQLTEDRAGAIRLIIDLPAPLYACDNPHV